MVLKIINEGSGEVKYVDRVQELDIINGLKAVMVPEGYKGSDIMVFEKIGTENPYFKISSMREGIRIMGCVKKEEYVIALHCHIVGDKLNSMQTFIMPNGKGFMVFLLGPNGKNLDRVI